MEQAVTYAARFESEATPRRVREAKKATVAASFGTFLEYYDFSCYGYVAAMLATAFFPGDNPTASLLSTLAVFGSAFIVRPLGGILFGHIGDRYGRKTALLATVLLMGLASTGIGLLPTYASIGVAAPALLITLRLLQGLSAGGEIGGAASYIREWAPPNRRALYISFIPGIAVLGKATAAGLAGMAAALFATSAPDWAWRVPFLVALPLMLGCLWIRLRIEDSPEFEHLRNTGGLAKAPFAELFKAYPGSLFKLMMFAMVQTIGTYIGTVYVAVYMKTVLRIPQSQVGFIVLIAVTCAAVLIPVFGFVTDRLGAKRTLAISYSLYIALSYPMYAMMGPESFNLTVLALVVTMLPYTMCQAGSYLMYPELLPTRVRSTGVSFGHSFGSVIGGGLMPFLATMLIDSFGDIMIPTYMLMANGMLGLVMILCVRDALPGDARKYR
ncbi:MHS family MFS transporter [Rhodovastum atsumiense]|uniref:MHS family MFS transporter n=1 Tax=Rhodovastum atsumiense TaxID=504468 RepID=A0A5M6IP93_9PROT|nr:MFS transporter [Rhodovastum atsumiense]KAA5610094.1 MHS family MFS transporter [Rhodovastum atsumiense]CAH2601434.1 MHS family MFS transporter [Rhodovastum atsumiense]